MTYEEFCQKFHIHLTSQQTEAVRSIEGPILLLAVPGSGKTTVLVTRLGYLVHCAGIAPENILTLTYTVAATHDMAARFASYFGKELGCRMEFRTINGICAKIIDYYSQLIGKKSFDLVTEDKLIAGLLSAIYLRVEGSYATEGDLKGIRTLITYIKNRMPGSSEINELDKEADCRISEIYRIYREELRGRGLMDYDDQMLYAHNILSKSPETLGYFRRRYPYICVDETQDTSKIQHAIIRLLAGGRQNLFMVGDEDQSIYGFRAAYPQALLSFEQNHPGATVLLMEENFRSNALIVEAADYFIQKNTLRHEKHMRAAREAGADIREIPLTSRGAQYAYLAKVAEECRIQTAVLYRDNESALPLLDLLERREIPYRIRNTDMVFFTHRVVQDIQNIILFALNPKDTERFLQIYYKLSTYINKQAALRICEISAEKDMAVPEAAVRFGHLEEKTEYSCRAVWLHLRRLPLDQAEQGLDRIAQDMGYRDYLKRAGISDSKLFILKAIARHEDSLQGLLERLAVLRRTIEEKKYDAQCSFILSTIHASKGLEYDRVYLMDVADGIFPETVPERMENMEEKERQNYEEERRLFYVAITRAKDMLSVFHLNRKSVFRTELFSQMKYMKFCDAIGEGLIVRHKKFGEGVIVEAGQTQVLIQFGNRQRRLDLKTLYENDLLVL
nr:ATP-dependent helicase [uncultured Acetatifactor sp.]